MRSTEDECLTAGSRLMKGIAFNGSPRKDGNTNRLINHVCTELQADAESKHVFSTEELKAALIEKRSR
jgi:hypothetical protein